MDTVHTVKNCFRWAAGVSAPKYAKRKTPATVCLSNSIFTKQLENPTVQKYTPRLETIIKTSRTYGVGSKNGTLTRETKMKEKKKTLLCLENYLNFASKYFKWICRDSGWVASYFKVSLMLVLDWMNLFSTFDTTMHKSFHLPVTSTTLVPLIDSPIIC